MLSRSPIGYSTQAVRLHYLRPDCQASCLINLDFADVQSVMSDMGRAMLGTGEATGERRAVHAAEAAIANPLIDDISDAGGPSSVDLRSTGGDDLTLFDLDEAASRIRQEVDDETRTSFSKGRRPLSLPSMV